MKRFNVFYDIRNDQGILEEYCYTVENVNNKSEAIHMFIKNKPANAIYRCAKAPLYSI